MILISNFYHLCTGGSAKTYRIVMAYPENKIHTILKHTGVFCIDKAGFLRLGHIYTI